MPNRPERTSVRACTPLLMGMLAVVAMLMPLVAAPMRAGASEAALEGHGSIDEAWMTGAAPGDAITLLRHGTKVASGTADALGSLILRNLSPGSGYRWEDVTSKERTGTFPVLAPGQNPPVHSPLYTDQPMSEGLNYIKMRDGIQLAATVRFPLGVTCSAADPCPTVIEYSGYATAAPTDPIPYAFCPVLGQPYCSEEGDANLLPDSATDVGGVVARVAGFAVVSLQMRGTGCSGGAFDLFGYPSDYDAYDAIEIVAHQSWVAHHKVGMVGISYSGLSQLPAAGTDPPGLAAITPLSPTDDLFSTGYPGGMYNSGFAASWVNQRIDDAKAAAQWSNGALAPLSSTPVANVAQPWTYYEIDAELAASGGTTSTCLANQALHDESEQLDSLTGPAQVAPLTASSPAGPGRTASLYDVRSMRDWAQHVTVPVFISGALEDDETGPQWPVLLNAFPASTPVFANMVNGGHIDSADPQVMSRWFEFLDIYVAHKVPSNPGLIADVVLDEFASQASGTTSQAPLPAYRFTTAPTLARARAAFAKQTPRVEVFFDNGASSAGAGDPGSSYSAGFSSWPPAGRVTTFYFHRDAALSTRAPATSSRAPFVLDPAARPATDLPANANPWAASPPWNWTTVPAADGVGFETAPFARDVTIVGPATVDLWVKSPTRSTLVEDYQATVTEVRPSTGQEEYVTSGFLRSSNQVDAPDSTQLFTDPTYLGTDAKPLSTGAYTLVKVPVDPIAHTFRAGTELRVVISAPGGDRPSWEFDTVDSGQTAVVGIGGPAASALVVNEVRGVQATASLPTCGSLRGEPCRAFVAESNGPTG
jgi:predicted acyl esterase